MSNPMQDQKALHLLLLLFHFLRDIDDWIFHQLDGKKENFEYQIFDCNYLYNYIYQILVFDKPLFPLYLRPL